MSVPSQRKIRDLLRTRESSRVDYKREYHLRTSENKNELAKDICAIANFLYQASGKGYLIIGADDNGTPIGVNQANYRETRLQQIVGARTDPPPIFQVHHLSYSGTDLVIIEIRRHSSGPHQVKIGTISQGFPTRRGSSTEAMDTIEVFQAMQVRGRSYIKSPSEYRTLSPSSARARPRSCNQHVKGLLGWNPR
jgi:predicted HTH transcriptional regulator